MKNILKTILIVIFFIFNSLNITFANNQISEQKEVIFVIDSSNSMKSFDKQRLALDEVKKIANSLTSEYKVGVVVYNTNIVDYSNLSNDLAYFNSILDRTKYTGYTNAGEALEFALNMFSNETNYKNIIMISDGEIILQNESLTNNSNEKFINAMDSAKNKGIIIDTIALGNLTKDGEKHNIFKASELTGGTVYKCDNILKLSKISNEILFNKFNIKKSLIGVANTTNGELNVNLPTTALDKVKILISSDEKISDINVNFKAESANIINGENFTIVEITKPYEKNVALKFTSNGSIEAYLISEYNASLYGEIVEYFYENNTVKAKVSLYLKNSNGDILNNDYYSNKEVLLNINNETYKGLIENEKIILNLDTLKLEENLNIQLQLDNFEENFLGINSIDLKLDKVIIDEILKTNKKDYKYLPLYIILLLLILSIIFIIYKNIENKKKEELKQEKLKKEREKALFKPKNPYTYSGKLNIYVISNEKGEDIAPQVFNLQRKETSDKITLKEILNACKLEIGDLSSENIIFEPSANKTLIMTNNSYSSIIKNGSLITFEKSVNINFNEKINITLEDEVTEIELHYKSLKPSEINNYI